MIAKPNDCAEIKAMEGHLYKPGPKHIHIKGIDVQVECDDDGYTVIQSRGQFGNDENYFYRNWTDYLSPFGTPGEEFWLGLKNIHYMTNEKSYGMKITAEDCDGNIDEATWTRFRLAENVSNARTSNVATKKTLLQMYFTLYVSGYQGGLGGDSMTPHNGKKFTTKDRDNDLNRGNCADSYKGAWWYNNNCISNGCNLNGFNYASRHAPSYRGIVYYYWKRNEHSLKSVKMAIKA